VTAASLSGNPDKAPGTSPEPLFIAVDMQALTTLRITPCLGVTSNDHASGSTCCGLSEGREPVANQSRRLPWRSRSNSRRCCERTSSSRRRCTWMLSRMNRCCSSVRPSPCRINQPSASASASPRSSSSSLCASCIHASKSARKLRARAATRGRHRASQPVWAVTHPLLVVCVRPTDVVSLQILSASVGKTR
jgi:hypothetical protein